MLSVAPLRAAASLTAAIVVVLRAPALNVGRATAHTARPSEGSADAVFTRGMFDGS